MKTVDICRFCCNRFNIYRTRNYPGGTYQWILFNFNCSPERSKIFEFRILRDTWVSFMCFIADLNKASQLKNQYKKDVKVDKVLVRKERVVRGLIDMVVILPMSTSAACMLVRVQTWPANSMYLGYLVHVDWRWFVTNTKLASRDIACTERNRQQTNN